MIMVEEKVAEEQKKKVKPVPREKAGIEKIKAVLKSEKKATEKKEEKPEAKKETKKVNFKFSAEKDPWKVIQYPMLTEKNIRIVEAENKLAFIVRREASKPQIKWAVEAALEVRVEKINTLIDRRGRKKAVVKLAPGFKAIDIATRFGML